MAEIIIDSDYYHRTLFELLMEQVFMGQKWWRSGDEVLK